ncbi:LysR family transcriptional regulator [Bordetella bronchiseptica]|uniref:LysR substrate-binding domain-containing protein n=1 Tax=Bordetella bronchiseptica TaxID=518 RepID=UPI00045B443A|nr:LysR substrate-binding domain-containing protein [Bordetella bronchiseptica]KCV59191.1 LysR substrate-binding domain protein [Bordetella bronchiseptica 99-R-0433]MBN3268530.1 LysR family transcriptional regulator [Bordetella bronchiseptica]
MELAELEIFRAVARTESVTRAAHALARVPSNVTTRLRQLEDSLGVTLFLRENKRMTLTPDGHRLLAYAERLLALAEETRQAMRADTPAGRLRLGAMESAAASRLPQPLASLHAQWPDLAIDLRTGTTQWLAGQVAACRLDCAVIAHPAASPADTVMAPLDASLRGAYLYSEELLLALPPGHPPARTPQDVRMRTLAAFAQGCTYRLCAEQWLDMAGVRVIEMASYHAMMAGVLAGSAMAILPRSVLALHPGAALVRTVPVRTVPCFLIHRDGYDSAARLALLRALQAPPAP